MEDKKILSFIYTTNIDTERDWRPFWSSVFSFVFLSSSLDIMAKIGLTSVYPKKIGFGLSAGMLLWYGLERCCTVVEVIEALKALPIASSQTFTVVDSQGMAAMRECNTDR